MIKYILLLLFVVSQVQISYSEFTQSVDCNLDFFGYMYVYYSYLYDPSTYRYLSWYSSSGAYYSTVMKFHCPHIEGKVTSMTWFGKLSYGWGNFKDDTVEVVALHKCGMANRYAYPNSEFSFGTDCTNELLTDGLAKNYGNIAARKIKASIFDSPAMGSFTGWSSTGESVTMNDNAWGMDITSDFDIGIALRLPKKVHMLMVISIRPICRL